MRERVREWHSNEKLCHMCSVCIISPPLFRPFPSLSDWYIGYFMWNFIFFQFLFPFAVGVLCVCIDDDENDPAIYIEYDNKEPIDEGPLEIMIV